MENKKSVKANLEKSKSSFLLIGLILAISFIVYAFSINSDKEYVDIKGVSPPLQEDITKITRPEVEKKEELKPEKPLPKKILAEVIIIVDSTKKVESRMWNPDDDTLFNNLPVIEPDEIIEIPSTPPISTLGDPETLRLYIAKHVVYPSEARENEIQGTVFLRFEVTKAGSIGKIEIFNKDQDELLKKASIDVIKTLPKFKPAIHNGKIVNAWFSIPISFKLN